MNTPAPVVTALVVDDQQLVRSGLSLILREEHGAVVIGECADGDEVLDAVERYQPDMVVMDLRMKRVGGIEATRLLAERGGPPVLALTTFSDDELLSGVLRAGAAGSCSKTHRLRNSFARSAPWAPATATSIPPSQPES